MDRAREGSVSAGARTKRLARRGLENAPLSLPSPLLSSVAGVCGRSWMQNGMGDGKRESLAEVGLWCRQTERLGEWGGGSCVVWEGFLVEGALGLSWPTSEGSGIETVGEG